ncbi:hypothetical protein ACFV6E_34015 [Streptomyces sp. NPDC059785]|uniref:hypothetical protein n=1 Tax=Streptomyces sp. NPDC059785 TaxID=3346945 RepID=UPI00366427EE
MRTQRQASGGNGQAGNGRTGTDGGGAKSGPLPGRPAPVVHQDDMAARPPSPSAASGMTPQALLALQRTAGNAAAAQALQRRPAVEGVTRSPRTPRSAGTPLSAITEGDETENSTPTAPPRAVRGTGATGLSAPLSVIHEDEETEQADGSARSEEAAKAGGTGRKAATDRPDRVPRTPRSRRPGGSRPGPSGAPAVAAPIGLPPYLRDLRAPGLSTAYRPTGHEFVATTLSTVVGRTDGTVAEIVADLAGRPETFYGQGRSFAVQGAEGRGWYDVTVTVSRGSGDRPETFVAPETVQAQAKAAEKQQAIAAFLAEREAAAGKGKGRARAETSGTDGAAPAPAPDPRLAEGADTKVDMQHNTSAVVSHTAAASSSAGVNFTAFGLAPVVPGVWLGGAVMANAQPFQSSSDSRVQKTVSEPRVLRSDKGSVEMLRRVRYGVRIQRLDEAPQDFGAEGTLTMRVPTEHLVPVTAATPAPGRLSPLNRRAARGVRLADSLAPVALDDSGAPHPGGGGLFDTVRSVLHPSLTSRGAPGRARLYDATSSATVLEDLPRLLNGWVMGEDLTAKDGSITGTYRMRADLTALTPAWSIGKTQLRTHQQTQHSVANTAAKGRAVTAGAGPAAGFGVLGSAAAVRGTVMPTAGARKARFTVAEQTVSSRQGAEVRGDKVLYFGTVRFSVEGTGPLSPAMKVRAGTRSARHTMDVWVSLRADEAASLGLELPEGVTAGPMVSRPAGADDKDKGEGRERELAPGESEAESSTRKTADTERHLPFGAMGSNVAISQLDTAPLLSGIERLFASDPRLAGYLPGFGAATTRTGAEASAEDAEVQRRNYRELVAVLSETNLRVNKDQLMSSGIRVRMRRKSRWHAHDVQIRVVGAFRETGYLGETRDWLVRSHSGVTGNVQSGRSSSRSVGGLALGQFRLIPGALSASLRGERTYQSSRRNQAGPTTRSDVLTNGGETTSTFGGALRLDVDVTMTTRERKAKRSLTPGGPGRDVPEAEHIASSADTADLALEEQDVRLLTPTGFTLDTAAKDRLDARTRRRTAGAGPAQRQFQAAGIGDLSAMTPQHLARPVVRDWSLVETVGDGAPIRELAFQLLGRAAARDRNLRSDPALATEGLAPRLAVEERFSPQAVTAALRQAVSSGWVVKDLRHPRRLAGLNGAVGTRFALAGASVIASGTGPGTETFILGGHQATGQEGKGVSTSVQGGMLGSENGPEWRLGQGVSASRNLSSGAATATTLSGTVERNAHTPRKRPLYLVQCDLVVRMVAEVKVTGGGPYVVTGERTLPAAAAVWLTAEQVRAARLRLPESVAKTAPLPERKAPEAEKAKATEKAAVQDGGTGASTSASGAPAPGPSLARQLPLGFGMIEELPDFVPLLERFRGRIGERDRALSDALLPRRQLADRNDNVQRLMRVLDRDGSAGLLSGAMDGGVTVELFHGRRTPYWAVFRVNRTGPGTSEGEADDGRDMEYITSAAAQRASSRESTDSRALEGTFAGAGKPDGGAGQLKNVGGVAGAGVGKSDSVKNADVSRGQLGMKTVAEAATARSVRLRLPVEATLELHSADGVVARAVLADQSLVHRILVKDAEALSRLQPVPRAQQGQSYLRRDDAEANRLGPWHARGLRLPMEAQVNGFSGAPDVRRVIDDTVRAAQGGDRFRKAGETAAYTQREAVSTEWLLSALPLLTAAGADLPVVHASGARGQDLRTSLHARLRGGRVLGAGDKMTFETVAQSGLDGLRPTGTDHQQAAEHSRTARGLGGAGVLNADEFRMNQLLANADSVGGATDTAVNASGSMPLHKPKAQSVLVQFTLDVRVVARVRDRGRSRDSSVAVRDLTLPVPVVVRMPAPAVRALLADPDNAAKLQDPDGRLAPAPPAP